MIERHATMKTKLMTTIICMLALLTNRPTPVFASSDSDSDALSVAVDVTVARPFTFALTILGSAVFVVSLPIAIPTGSLKTAGHILVAQPAKDTFTRPVGDLHHFLAY